MALEEATVNISYRNLSRRLQECDPVILHGASAHREAPCKAQGASGRTRGRFNVLFGAMRKRSPR